jgi:thiosulfate dehydrogenase
MPDKINYKTTVLTNEEAWDVAAFVNSQPRPSKTFKEDWPDISTKPFDHPFGPYADNFSANQHKYGPFGPIDKGIKEREKKKAAATAKK